MAGHEWDDWFEREELIGQISDIRVQNLQAEREGIQKRTFTRWMNLHLEKCNPPVEITDLFREIRDGRILMALLEELSGCKLLHGFKPSSHRIFRLNNIAKVLDFLEERNVKLISIDAADVADGNSSLVLGLIWNIILFFQIKELTGTIQSRFSSTSSLSSLPSSTDSDTSHPGTPAEERPPSHPRREHGKAIRTLLHWVQRRTTKYGVVVQDFGKSWVSGLAFLAVIKSIDSSLVDMRKARLRTPRQNIEDAFRIAHYSLGIPRLLEPEDVAISSPDEQSIMTYVSQFLEHFPGHNQEETSEVIERSALIANAGTRLDRTSVNGVHRERPRPYVPRKDSAPPPPKIFISSVPDDILRVSPADGDVQRDSQLDKEGSAELKESPKRPLDLGKEVVSVSPQLSCKDSAIDSPDSWSEMTSEAALLDSPGLPNDSPCSISPDEEKVSPDATVQEPTLLGEVKEGPVFQEPFIDDGNISQTSIDSFQTHSKLSLEEEDAYQYILGLNEDQMDIESPQEEVQNGLNFDSEQTSMFGPKNLEAASNPELSEELKSKDVSHKMESGSRPQSEQKEMSSLEDKSNTEPIIPQLCEEKEIAEILPETHLDLVSGVDESEATQKQNDVTTALPADTVVDLVELGDFSVEAGSLKQENKYPVDQDLSGCGSLGQEDPYVLSEDQDHFTNHTESQEGNLDQNNSDFCKDQDHVEVQGKNKNLHYATDLSEDQDHIVALFEDQELSRCLSQVHNTNLDQDITAHSENQKLICSEFEGQDNLDQNHISLFEGQVHARLVYAVEGDEDKDLPLDLLSDAPSGSNVGIIGGNECSATSVDIPDVSPSRETSDVAFSTGDPYCKSQDSGEDFAKEADVKAKSADEHGSDLASLMDADDVPESRFADTSCPLDCECASGTFCDHSAGSEDQAARVKPGSPRIFCAVCGKEKVEEAEEPQPCGLAKASTESAAATPRKVPRPLVTTAPPGGVTTPELQFMLLLWLLLYCLLVLPQLDLQTLPRLLLNLEE